MTKNTLCALCAFLFSFLCASCLYAQTIPSNYLVAQPRTDRTVPFSLAGEGTPQSILWGLDTAWPSEDNIRRGIAFMDSLTVDLVRVSFQPTRSLVDGEFQEGTYTGDDGATWESQTWWLDTRLSYVDLVGPHAKLTLNSDHPFVNSWYKQSLIPYVSAATAATRWTQLIKATTKYVKEKGYDVVTISPFNEPDYTAVGQGSKTVFGNICANIKADSYFDDIRVSGGNTLNPDYALEWYNQAKTNLDEGNTHQLAGTFDNYAGFFQQVRNDGKYALADELHNVMEAIVGVEYGMQTGIWWGTAEYARGEYCKATRPGGVRLGYAEHRTNWTAASVQRAPDGKVQAFVGSSERQATTTTYRFFSEDMPVYYDGYGPQYEYIVELLSGEQPGDYQTSLHTNGETVVNIQTGEDVPQYPINGKYVLVNRENGRVLTVQSGNTNNGASIRRETYVPNATHQQWTVTPVPARVGGDFSYFTFIPANAPTKGLDLLNFSLAENATISMWDYSLNGAQQFYLEYAGDGYYYIRSRHSAKCIQSSRTNNIQQGRKIESIDGYKQQWRFVPIDIAATEFVAPSAPTNLTAMAQTASIKLTWSASPETDVVGYNIYRSKTVDGVYQTIARSVTATSFVDNTTNTNETYYYKVKAVDKLINRSADSNVSSASVAVNSNMVARFDFTDNLQDETHNANHASIYGTPSFTTGKIGEKAVMLDGTSQFLQLPTAIANHNAITIATWVYWSGNSKWQRIFDFGNSEEQYMFLTPKDDSDNICFGIRNGSDEQQLNTSTTLAQNTWVHIALTLSDVETCLYIDGQLIASSNSITITPAQFMPKLNYIGRSQFDVDPLFNGEVDDFRVYNYALTYSEILKVMNNEEQTPTSLHKEQENKDSLSVWPSPAIDVLHVSCNGIEQAILAVYDVQGKFMGSYELKNGHAEINVSGFSSGNYLLRYSDGPNTITKQFVVK